MEFLLRWGKDLDFLQGLAEDAIEREAWDEYPAALVERGELPDHLAWYVEAYYTLSPSRQVGFGPGGILLAEMLAYAAIFGVSDVQRFVRYMQSLDVLYLEHYRETHKTPD